MKTLLCMILLAFSTSAFALGFGSGVPFANASSAGSATKNSAVYNTTGFKQKTVTVSGVVLTSSPSAITYKNMSGVVTALCGPSSNGPWSTCAQGQSTAGAAVTITNVATGTGSTVLTWEDASPYVKLKWVVTASGQKIKAWLNWQE
jgi:hypothetical protein